MPIEFSPPRKLGIILQMGAILVLLAFASASFWLGWLSPAGGGFIVFLVLALASIAPILLLVYHLYALVGARYSLDRDGIRLHWGLRQEDIPLQEVDWVRPPDQILDLLPGRPRRLRLPLVWWPGAVRGVRSIRGLGPVEYIASDPWHLLLIATPQRIFAISPADSQAFIQAFNRISELGSLSPLAHQSVYPVSVFERLWANRLARTLLLSGFGLGVLLLAWVGAVIPSRARLPLTFSPIGAPADLYPSERLLLLPVVNGFAFLADLLGGLFFFRHDQQRPVAYLLWAGSILTPVLMMIAVVMILGG